MYPIGVEFFQMLMTSTLFWVWTLHYGSKRVGKEVHFTVTIHAWRQQNRLIHKLTTTTAGPLTVHLDAILNSQPKTAAFMYPHNLHRAIAEKDRTTTSIKHGLSTGQQQAPSWINSSIVIQIPKYVQQNFDTFNMNNIPVQTQYYQI